MSAAVGITATLSQRVKPMKVAAILALAVTVGTVASRRLGDRRAAETPTAYEGQDERPSLHDPAPWLTGTSRFVIVMLRSTTTWKIAMENAAASRGFAFLRKSPGRSLKPRYQSSIVRYGL